ncbi:MAG: response regulator [Lachnospiraceae bacterium]|nr:response regulator [Lachnospiraceae bacterium]
MKLDKKSIIKNLDFIYPKGGSLQAKVFDILAKCGLAVCIISAIISVLVEDGFKSFFWNMLGALISLVLLKYTRKTGRYRPSMILTIIVIFIGLFSFLFFTGGGYHSGMPCFFIFATVFTAFMLDGIIMPIFVFIELAWYSLILMWAHYNPGSVKLIYNEKAIFADVWVDVLIVSLSLSITMYLQMKAYRNKEKELGEAILVAEEANRAKSDFLAKMSHDIRTPLNTIMAMNEMIVDNTSSARIRGWVNDSNVSGRILLSLIDDMLDLTKIEAGRMDLLSQPWDTGALFSEIARLWKVQAQKEGLEFEYEMDAAVPPTLLGDEDVIRKVVNNLLSNSVKYTKKGCIRLNVSWDGELVLVVEDTGIGIAPEHLENIFNPFERGVQDIYRETSGSGLGLAIVKELVDAMKGTINCKSVLNEGSVFTVRLPLGIYTGKIAKTKEEPSDIKTGGTKKRFVAPDARVLVVDDNTFNHKVIEEFLEPSLIQIDEVESGYEALEMIDIRHYDLVLMDLRMPKMDGAETLERIRSEYPDFDAPVVVLTADIMNGVEQSLLEKGFAGFLAKPVSSQKLFETIASFIPDKIVSIETENENDMSLAQIEDRQDMLMPYGIDLKLALENNAANFEEFMMRVDLFEQYADENLKKLGVSSYDENYYIFIHSVKSIAWGIGAFLLARLSETVEYRNDKEFSNMMNPVIIDEYKRVRSGLAILKSEVG